MKIVFLMAALLIFGFLFLPGLNAEITINDDIFKTEIAFFPEEMEKGLSQRDSLEENQGMLFVFLNPRRPVFWMKDMKFPLDVLWIRGETIVEISENIPLFTQGEITVLKPNQEIDKAMEIKAGSVSKYGIKTGDKLKIRYELKADKQERRSD
ncbi:MAG: DUF192 domain-containing protein [Candidatus Paceibacterota bacterium]|jgi:hypothetical protein|nr:DUF192 domain-containing protein [Candidatus Paceibacterota bacterium]